MKLTIIIPVFNEERTIETIIEKILIQKNIDKEIIIIDDGSTDRTVEILKNRIASKVTKIIYHQHNKGKGAAIRSAIKFISGEIVIIQDADLEYDPSDYKILIQPIVDKSFEVVYGSRVLGKKRYSKNNFLSNFRVLANHILTVVSNSLNKQNLTDAHTCYKLFKSEIIKNLNLEENGFAFCPEVTTKISKMKIPIKEVPISYHGRSFADGKKIGYKDGFEALYALFKYKFF